jgi:hypothetical protein
LCLPGAKISDHFTPTRRASNSVNMVWMKPALPPPQRPDGTPFTTLDSLFRAVIAVPKTEIDKREKEWKRAQKKKRTKR